MDLGPLIVELQKQFDTYGPQTLVMAIGENNLPLSITEVKVDGEQESGYTIWLKAEEI